MCNSIRPPSDTKDTKLSQIQSITCYVKDNVLQPRTRDELRIARSLRRHPTLGPCRSSRQPQEQTEFSHCFGLAIYLPARVKIGSDASNAYVIQKSSEWHVGLASDARTSFKPRRFFWGPQSKLRKSEAGHSSAVASLGQREARRAAGPSRPGVFQLNSRSPHITATMRLPRR
jgi:hypothetical protein